MQSQSEIKLNEDQQRAVELAVSRNFSLVAGGAGSGKTTLIKEIFNQVKNPIICTPTGKAAARVREASGFPSSTIHSALKYDGTTFKLENLKGRSVIIDEASMVDSWLLHAVISRTPDKIVLIGDEAQLPPVGSGAPFHDLVRYRPDITTRLTICYRNTEAVFHAANMIREGDCPPPVLESANEHWELRQTGGPEATQEQIIKWVKDGFFDFEKDIILTPRSRPRSGNNGNDEAVSDHCMAAGINRQIVNLLNPRDERDGFQVGDRVICTKNFAASDVWNGTTGTVTGTSRGTLWVKGDIPFLQGERYVSEIEWQNEIVRNVEHAYALTVHKSQGSQYRNVAFCCLSRDLYALLSRPLVYTAVTRAKEVCVCMGDQRTLSMGICRGLNKTTVIQEIANVKDETEDKDE